MINKPVQEPQGLLGVTAEDHASCCTPHSHDIVFFVLGNSAEQHTFSP